MFSFRSSPLRRAALAVGALICALSLLIAGCSDDPVLGPDEGEPDDSGGSYSVIKRLAPSDSADSSSRNPERF
ncbi:MAG: hypothetical protein BRD55_04465 [Bacteroidetes bacterium SW_9_63_38]|nr:MAG: hypothetical protein BRD55_04465 [Bacteroidetes bacterium SW_9_63_38]